MVDDAQAERAITNFKTNLTSLTTPTNTVTRNMNSMNQAFSAGVNPIKSQGNALTTLNTNLKTTSTTATTLGSKIKGTASQFAGFATGLSATTSGVLSLAAGFRDYSDAQIAVDRQTRKVSLATEAQHKAVDKLNALTAKGIKSGKAYEQAQLDVSQANQQLSIMTQLLSERQEDMFDAQSQFVASVIPTTLGAIGTLGSAFKDLGGTKGLGGLADKFKGLGSTISGAFGSIGGLSGGLSGLIAVLGPLALAIGAAALAWESYNEAMANVAKGKKELELAKDAKLLTDQVNHLNKAFNDFKISPEKGPAQFIASLGPAPGILNKVLDVMKDEAVQTAKNTAESQKLIKAKNDLAVAEKNYQNAPRQDKEHAKDIRDNAAAEGQRLQTIEDAIPANQKYTATYKALHPEIANTTKTISDQTAQWAAQAKELQGGTGTTT